MFKAGDKVLICSSGVCQNDRIAVVEKVMPSGRFKAAGMVFRPDGVRYGQRNSWVSVSARPATTEDEERIMNAEKKAANVRRLDGTRWGSLPLDSLEAIIAIIEKGGQ